MTSRVPYGLAALAVLGACAREKPLVRAIAPVGPATASGVYSIDSAPALIIPGATSDGRVDIGYVKDATRLSDGTVVIADGYDRALHFFEASGDLAGTKGGQGSGPGEFQTISWLGQCGPDSVFVWDDAQFRLSVFDRHGELSREGHLPGRPAIIACSPSGIIATLVDAVGGAQPSAQEPRLTGRLVFLSEKGDSVWSRPDIFVGQRRPLAPLTRIAVGKNRVFVGTGDSAYVNAYDFGGQRVTALRVGNGLRTPTRRHYEKAIDWQLALLPGSAEARKMIKEKMLAIPLPEHLPPYADIFVDPTDALWVVTSAAGDDTTTMEAFSPTGDPLGSVTVPVDMRVFEIGIDYILGVFELPDGEEIVAVYNYTRST